MYANCHFVMYIHNFFTNYIQRNASIEMFLLPSFSRKWQTPDSYFTHLIILSNDVNQYCEILCYGREIDILYVVYPVVMHNDNEKIKNNHNYILCQFTLYYTAACFVFFLKKTITS